jgi:hypothetical protein
MDRCVLDAGILSEIIKGKNQAVLAKAQAYLADLLLLALAWLTPASAFAAEGAHVQVGATTRVLAEEPAAPVADSGRATQLFVLSGLDMRGGVPLSERVRFDLALRVEETVATFVNLDGGMFVGVGAGVRVRAAGRVAPFAGLQVGYGRYHWAYNESAAGDYVVRLQSQTLSAQGELGLLLDVGSQWEVGLGTLVGSSLIGWNHARDSQGYDDASVDGPTLQSLGVLLFVGYRFR